MEMFYILIWEAVTWILLFSCQVLSYSMRPHRLQHARPPCPSPPPRVCWSSCPLNRWCHPTISSFVTPFSFFLQCLPASGSFPMNRLFASSGQRFGASASVLPINILDWFPLGLTYVSLQGTLKSLLQHHSSKISILQHSAFFMVQLSQPYMTTGKTLALTIWTFVGRATSLLFNTLSRFVIAFLPRSKHLLI